MEEINICTKISVCSYEELEDHEKSIISAAKKAALDAYAPYSGFQVGAAVLLENNILITGNNQENASYPVGLCAERTAVFYANSQYPDQVVVYLAIAAYTKGRYTQSNISPCGSCRQVLLETEQRYNRDIKVLLYGENRIYKINSIKDLLPLSFCDKSLSLND